MATNITPIDILNADVLMRGNPVFPPKGKKRNAHVKLYSLGLVNRYANMVTREMAARNVLDASTTIHVPEPVVNFDVNISGTGIGSLRRYATDKGGFVGQFVLGLSKVIIDYRAERGDDPIDSVYTYMYEYLRNLPRQIEAHKVLFPLTWKLIDDFVFDAQLTVETKYQYLERAEYVVNKEWDLVEDLNDDEYSSFEESEEILA